MTTRRQFLTLTGAALLSAALPAHAATRPRVLIVGDSYTEGVGDEPTHAGYVTDLARTHPAWTITRDGRGGSGYRNPTTYQAGTFATRINRRYYAHPQVGYDLIVLQGSSNDQKYTSTQLAGAVNMTLRTVERRYPHARTVMVGPTNPYGKPGPDLWRVNAKLHQYATIHTVPYIDPLSEWWFVPGDGARYATPTGPGHGHPNRAGYAHYADRLTTALGRIGIR